MISVEKITKVYETKEKLNFFRRKKTYVEAVKGISMQIEEGKIIGLLGINGAGKTTTIKMLSTLLSPTSGKIIVDGVDAVKNAMEIKKKVNMVAGGERMLYWRLTARENLWYYGQLYGIENKKLNIKINNLLSLVGLSEKADIPVEKYSKGMKQRLQIARGLINDPNYIFMDEPTLGLDAVIAKELRAHVKQISHEEGKGILLTSHYMAEIEELCDYIYILNKGEILQHGTKKELTSTILNKKVLKLKIANDNEKISSKFKGFCSSIDQTTVIDRCPEDMEYTIKSSVDLVIPVSKFCVDNNLIIRKLYEEESRLEDAIIKLAKEA
jgi:ABC-2 type transport system ATP-binding protein